MKHILKHLSGKKHLSVCSYKICTRCIIFLFPLLAVLQACNNSAPTKCEWNGFHGSDRSNKSVETGLIKKWPAEGPDLLWTASGLGEGYSSVSAGSGALYTAGTHEDLVYVIALNLDGELLWKVPNGKSWSTTMSHARSYTGARSTPTYDNGVIYHLGEVGRLVALDAKTGEEIWSKELMSEFDAKYPEYGYAESVLTDGDNLYVRAAGKKGFQLCLNKHNGEVIWVNTNITGVEGYSSPVITDIGGYRQIINSSSDCYYGLDSKTGKLLWRMDFENDRSLNIADAVVYNEYILISSGYGKGSMLFKLNVSGEEIIPEIIWQSGLMDNHHGGIILHDGYLYGSGAGSRNWYCLDFMTGKQAWKARGKGSLTYADEMLYLIEEKGIMMLVSAISGTYDLQGEFKVPEGGPGMYWAHPVVCGGRLYIRHSDKLYAYNISVK